MLLHRNPPFIQRSQNLIALPIKKVNKTLTFLQRFIRKVNAQFPPISQAQLGAD